MERLQNRNNSMQEMHKDAAVDNFRWITFYPQQEIHMEKMVPENTSRENGGDTMTAITHDQARVRVGELGAASCASWELRLRELHDNDGLTLRAGHEVSYKTGWQVADYGYECTSASEAAEKIVEMSENCGVWYSDGIYYIDHSFRVKTKREAMRIGREHKQISILKWSNMSLAYC